MKKQILAGLFAALVAVTGCQKDDLSEKVNDLDKRVSALEEKVKELNERTIPGIQATVAALQANIYVTNVTVLKDGYEITFSDGTKATIANGKDGKDGEKGERGPEPVISAQEIEGEFYWTVDGKPMLDAQGKKIPVHAALPQLRINEGKWEVSYDEGKTWKEVPTMGSGGAAISIEDTDTEIIFYINGKKYVVKKEVPFFMVFEKREMAVGKGETALVEYNISGILATDEVEVDVLSCTQGWEAKVMSVAKADAPGYLAVTNNEGISGKIFVYAANGKGKTDIKSLVFEDGQFITVIDAKTITAAGGDFSFKITTNIDYEVSVDPDQTWLTYEPETKAVHTDVITLKAQENTTNAFRTAEVYVTDPNSGSILEEFVVAQYPNETVTTDLASLANVEDGTTVVVNGVKVVASSKNSAVIYDGTLAVYVKGLALPVGKDVKIEGEKQTMDDYGTPMLIAGKFETKAGSSSIKDPAFNYLGVATNYSPGRTMTAGVLRSSKGTSEKNYRLTAPMGQTVNIETPDASIDLAAFDGKLVEVEGYTTVVVWPETEDEAETTGFILEGIKAITVQENPNWTLSYSYAAGEEYPEIIKNTVSGSDKGRYALTYYSVEDMKEYYGIESISDPAFPETVSIMFADDFQYTAYYAYPVFLGIPTEEVFAELTAVGTSDQSFEELEYGKYIAVATGIDDIGGASGYYAAIEFEKKEPVSVATYADFLGKWTMGSTVLEITQDVQNETYKVSGLPGQPAGITYSAKFVDKKLVLSEQAIKVSGGYVVLSGMFSADGQNYYSYGTPNSSVPDILFNGYMLESGEVVVKPGANTSYDLKFFGMGQIKCDSSMTPQGTIGASVTFADMKRYEEKKSVAKYEDFLGEWTMGGASFVIAEAQKGSTYTVSGFPQQEQVKATVYARFEDGKFILEEQMTEGSMTHTSYGECAISCAGSFVSGGQTYPAYPVNCDSPATIFTAYMNEDGSVDVEKGACEYGVFSGMCLSWVIKSGQNAGKGNCFTSIALGNAMTKVQTSEGYAKWLGNWSVERPEYVPDETTQTYVPSGKTITDTWKITKNVANESYNIEGIEGTTEAEDGLIATALYDAATQTISLHYQTMLTWTYQNQTFNEILVGYALASDGKTYRVTADVAPICTIALKEPGVAEMTPGEFEDGGMKFVFNQIRIHQEMGGKYYIYNGYGTPIPTSMVAAGNAPASLGAKMTKVGRNAVQYTPAPVAKCKAVSNDNNAVIRKFSPSENDRKALKPCRKADKKIVRK